jgi:hypothetical protein
MTTSVGYFDLLPSATPFRKEVISVAAKIQALLLVLGAIVVAALNGASPWGP